MRNNLIYLFLLSSIIFSSCAPGKKAAKTVGPTVINGVEEAAVMLDMVKATDLPYTWFGAQGSGTIDWDGSRYNVRMNVRIERDKRIWVQIQKLGFEIGRMLVTPDSAFFINRLERSYSLYSTTEFFKEYNLPADFDMFSKVFTGGAYLPQFISKYNIESDRSLYLESDSGVNARHWLDTASVLSQSIVTDQFEHEWAAGYGDYRPTNTGLVFPFRRTNTLVIEGESNLFDIEYSFIEIDVPQEFPFSIPSHYEKL